MYNAKPAIVNKKLLEDKLNMGFLMTKNLLAVPSLTIPTINIPALPKIPNISVPSVPSLPKISIPKFNINLGLSIPTMQLGQLPGIPNIAIPQLPKISFTDLGIPIRGLNIQPPRLPSINFNALPKIPGLNIPILPVIALPILPNLVEKQAKARVIFSLALSLGLSLYWANAKLSTVPPPGTVQVIDNSVVSQIPPGNTIIINNNDKKELPSKIAKTAKVHLQGISGVTTAVASNGSTIMLP